MRAVLVVRAALADVLRLHPAHARRPALTIQTDNHHIRIVPAVRTREGRHRHRILRHMHDRGPLVRNIARQPPHICAHAAHPLGHFSTAETAGEKDIPAALAQRLSHPAEQLRRVGARRNVAEVIFQQVDAPLGKFARILPLVAVAARAVGVGQDARAGIKAEFQPALVDIIAQCLHPGRKRLRIGLQIAVCVALKRHPAIIHRNIRIARVAEALFHHRVGRLAHDLLIDFPRPEIIPGVPPHRGLWCH